MRPTITAAQLPLQRVENELLYELHGRFDEAFAARRTAPSAERIATQVRRLSDIYNHLSPQNPYGRPELVDARLHFFMPTDIVKVWGPVGEVAPHLDLAGRTSLSLLDLGGGTGTATIGTAMVLRAAGFTGQLKVTVVEPDQAVSRHLHTSLEALRDAGIGEVTWQHENADIETFLSKPGKERFDLVIVLNVLCEAFPEADYPAKTVALLKQISVRNLKENGFAIVIEPALKRFARLLTEAGMQLQNATHTLFAPCKPPLCEQLEKPNGFCFHAQKVPMTPLLQRISAFSGLDRYEVNYAYLTLSPKAMRQPHPELPEGAVAGRIVSFPKRVKKGFNYFVCTPEGLIVAFAARFLPETTTKGGRLPHGTLVTVER